MRSDIYKCEKCNNLIEILNPGNGKLICCEEPMELLMAKTEDEGMEKHVPVIETTENGILVKIGDVPHPMTQEHHIEWIQVITKDGKSYRKYLDSTENPQANFCIKENEIMVIREHCNIHGLWKK